jgi:hypothetical protein
MYNFARKFNPLLLPAVLIAASALMFCEPGNSLNPGTPDNTPADTGKTARIRILSKPDQLLPADTGLVSIFVADSADTATPLKGAKLSVTSTQFALISAGSATAFPADSSAVPSDGMVNFRIHSSTTGTASVIVRVTSGTRQRSVSFTVQVTESPVAPKLVVDEAHFPKQLRVGDTTLISFQVADSAQGKALSGAAVAMSSDVFSIFQPLSNDSLSLDTTAGDGNISLRLLASSATPDHGFLQVRVKTAAGVTRIKTFNFNVAADQGVDRPRQMVFTAMRSTLRADGSDSTELRVLIKDDNNNPLAGEKLHFTATGGVVRSEATTDSWGKAATVLVSERVNRTVVVTAILDKTGATAQQSVSFDGVTISISPDKKVLPTGSSDPVTFELRDGGQSPMSGDSIEIVVKGAFNGFAQSGKDSMIVVTDTRGQYKTDVVAKVDTAVRITARSLGAKSADTVTFTSRTLGITSSQAFLTGDGADQATITATLKNGAGAGMDDIELRWSTTFGNFTSSPFTTTAGGGKASIVLRAPKASGVATVNVEAYQKGSGSSRTLIASGNLNVPVKALKVNRLELKVTPDNIAVQVGEARLIAQAFDSASNVMTGVLVAFKLIKGAGGGDELILPPVDYTKAGIAEAVLKAGGAISLYRGVKIAAVALDISGTDTLVIASSDTVGLTVSGPPAKVSVGANILKGENPNDGTFALPVAAVVTDVNGNLVADGVPVNFSTTPVAAIIYSLSYHILNTEPGYAIDTIADFLPWTDYNNNRKLDVDEIVSSADLTLSHPFRGEDIDGNGFINFPPDDFEDIDGNGLRGGSANFPVEPTVVFMTDAGSRETTFVDFNHNNRQDTVEPILRDVNRDTVCQCAGTYDGAGNLYESTYFGSASNHPFPGEVSVGINKEIGTAGGKATTKIIYVQSMANKVKMRVTAEANGFRSSYDVILPVVKDDK